MNSTLFLEMLSTPPGNIKFTNMLSIFKNFPRATPSALENNHFVIENKIHYVMLFIIFFEKPKQVITNTQRKHISEATHLITTSLN